MAKSAGGPAPFDTTLGERACALAVEHRAALEPRLPAGTIDGLEAALLTLGVSPTPQTGALVAAAPQAPSLAEALAVATNLVTAIHATVLGAKAKPAVRRAYGATSKGVGHEVARVLAAAEKIEKQATGDPSEALALGILPDDITALRAASRDLAAAEAAARGGGRPAGATKREKQAAAVRMNEALGRIAGAGALAFAQSAAVRAEFEALKPKKNE